MTPTVSVVLSVFNGEDYLRPAIESILSQTYGDFEVVAINDGSTDRSGNYLDEYAATDARIRVIHQENQGLTRSLNLGIRRARGRYIARMDADDISYPERLQKQAAVLDTSPSTVLVTTALDRIDDNSELVTQIDRSEYSSVLTWYLMFFNVLGGHGQVMYRRDIVLEAGGYDESIRTSQDYDLWCRLASYGEFEFIREVLYAYRTHANAISIAKGDVQRASSYAISQRMAKELTGVALEYKVLEASRRFWIRRPSTKMTSIRSIHELDRVLRRLLKVYVEGDTEAGRTEYDVATAVAERYSAWAERTSTIRKPVSVVFLYYMIRKWNQIASNCRYTGSV